jgi:hypothetical protein
LQEGRIAGRQGQNWHIALGYEKVPTPHILAKLEEFVKESVNCSLEVWLLAAPWIDVIILTQPMHPQDLIHCKDTLHAGLSVTKVKAPKRKKLERPTLAELDHDQDLRLSFALNDFKRFLRPIREATEG